MQINKLILIFFLIITVGAGCSSRIANTSQRNTEQPLQPLPTISPTTSTQKLAQFYDAVHEVSFSYPHEWGTLPISVMSGSGTTITIGRPTTHDDTSPPLTYFNLQISQTSQGNEGFTEEEIQAICRGERKNPPLTFYIGCADIQGRPTLFVQYDTDAYGVESYAFQYQAESRTPYIKVRTALEDPSWSDHIQTVLGTLKIKK